MVGGVLVLVLFRARSGWYALLIDEHDPLLSRRNEKDTITENVDISPLQSKRVILNTILINK